MEKKIMLDFEQFLVAFRRKKGFQVKEVSNLTGIPYETLKAAELGERSLSKTETLAVAYVLEIPKEKLNNFYGKGDNYLPEGVNVSNMSKEEFNTKLGTIIDNACKKKKIDNSDLVQMLSISLTDAVMLRVGLISVKEEWIEILSRELDIPQTEFER